ncbi:MAG: hypothetical protein IPP71_02660 [Bacteroidetes bacterium]|nr:hypothetical protein [Bacteroidota bacterium]
MKRIIFTLCLCCVLTTPLFSQGTITIYYDKNWEEISNEKEAVYYRKAISESDNVWQVNDYYITDTLQMSGTYKSRKFNIRYGHFVYYFENGQKDSEGIFVDDKRDGEWNFYHENGKKKSSGKFILDDKSGFWQYWDENGRLKSTENDSKPNNCTIEGFYPNGASSFKGTFQNNKPHGLWVYTNSKGRVTFSGNLKNGKKEGEWTRFYKEGNLKLVYKDGETVKQKLGGIVRGE